MTEDTAQWYSAYLLSVSEAMLLRIKTFKITKTVEASFSVDKNRSKDSAVASSMMTELLVWINK